MGKRSGFTLIELLVVIAIIALLMAILLPALQRARKQAKAVICQAHLKQWATALSSYTEENNGRFPDGGESAAIYLLRTPFCRDDDPSRLVTLHNRVETKGIACCPVAAKVDRNRVRSTYIITTRVNYFTWPTAQVRNGSTSEPWEAEKPGPSFLCSYGFNEWLLTPLRGPLSQAASSWYVNVSSLKGRFAIPVLLGCSMPSARPEENEGPPVDLSHAYLSEMARFCLDRHNGYTNGLFLDWSVRKVGIKELWALKWHRSYNTAGPWTKTGGIKPGDWPEWMRRFTDH